MVQKNIFLALLILFLSNCNNVSDDSNQISSVSDPSYGVDSIPSVMDLEKEQDAKEYADSMIRELHKEPFLDSTGMSQSPVVVLSAKLFKEEYSSYKSIKLSYKNVSNKKIQAIRFEWYGENAFGEPADMGSSIISGSGGGFTEEILMPGKVGSGVWSILSQDGKKVIMARAYEVAFADGTNWKLRK